MLYIQNKYAKYIIRVEQSLKHLRGLAIMIILLGMYYFTAISA